ncbi:MAG: hypothetical protein ACREQX_07605 [Candidatus Binataceae bacterium]
MKFYEKQFDSDCDRILYGRAMKALLELGGLELCKTEMVPLEPREVHMKLISLNDEDLGRLTLTAAIIDRANPHVAEFWVLHELGLLR